MRKPAIFVLAAVALGASAQPVAHPENQPMHTNRLAGETSPYLLQHAHNPVDWYPWGEEAFAEARRRGVPIFLSIGYSTCYWCHVMERESFEDEATAKVMNEHYVCIKVDREERPDVDDIYMAATQAMTGRGGWPMSVWLEPEHLRPFYCGTYFPPTERQGMPSFTQVLLGIAQAWDTKHADILTQSETLAEAVRQQLGAREAPVVVGSHEVETATATLVQNFDPQWGGFGNAPKFPQPTYLDFLLEVREAADDTTRSGIDAAIRTTLDKMLIGGVFDQVGGGFHRYSVDTEWTVPHFEKMLYDQGQLASSYARASRTYGDAEYRRVAERICDVVLREMTSPEGAFYSAQDAEVDGKEGLNYLWTLDELESVLEKEDAAFAADVYGVAKGTNFQDPHHPEEPPRNVLRLSARPEQIAERLGMDVDAFHARLDAINETLYASRMTRPQPRLDDKVLAGWNGLMIGGMADVGAMTGEARYVDAAAGAAGFIGDRMRDSDGQLLRTYRDGVAKTPAFFEDYAYLEEGLIKLHRAQLVLGRSGDAALQIAERLADEAQERFGDDETGGYFDTPAGQSDLFVRAHSVYDGAIPSATSVHLNALLDLASITGKPRFSDRATRGLVATSAAISRSPVSVANSTRALFRSLRSGDDLQVGYAQAGVEARADSVAPAAEVASPVEIFAEAERVSVSADEPGMLTLRLRVAPGYHIVAADPGREGEDFVIPLRVSITGGTGVSVYADYPAGEAYRVEGVDGALRVHTGEFELPIVLERTGEFTGRPMLVVTYQACTDSECLAPVTVELDVAIDVAG